MAEPSLAPAGRGRPRYVGKQAKPGNAAPQSNALASLKVIM
jgi:hypothetical protein